ncbi:MAG TPA: TonB-dependent receptor [Chitinophagaceae bacterium]|nr:TonB-dependent receptor [Chitinophagaceae bacterium]
MKYISSILFTFIIPFAVFSQDCTTSLSGHVEDADTKEMLSGAVVTIKETGTQLVTDAKGDFLFKTLCTGEYTLQISHVSCDSVERKISLNKDQHLDVYMPHARRTLGEVTVEAQKGIANTGFKKELSGNELEETKGLSLAEALSKINGVTMLQTGSTISKPVIHGLHSSRILTINNGVRQEGQQWGNEHAPEIDPFIADKLVIIKGVDELRYGSDAIAGVILVEPKALRNLPGYSGEINTAYFTNNRQYVISGVWEQQLKKLPSFSYRLQGTFKKGANATTPGYRLNNTGSEEKNFSVTATWRKEKFNTELFYSHFATKVGIFAGSHVGNLTDLQNAIAASKPDDIFLDQNTYHIRRPYQDVTHHLLKSKSTLRKGEHKFSLLVAGQFNHRREYDIVRSSTNTRPQLDLSIYTLSEDINWEHPKQNGFNGIAGVSLMQQDNSYSGRYFIPNYFAYSFGGYFIEKWSRHQWELQAGIRYDNKTINTTRLKFNGDTINHDFNFSTFASSFNAIYKASNNWRFNINIGLASRAPYVNELLSDGIHHGTATYEKGDITLQPEKSTNISVGTNFQNTPKTVSLDLLLYANSIHDFIYQQPMPDSPVLTIAGAFPLIEYKQTDALLSGFDLGATCKLLSNLQWESKLSVLYARNNIQKDWLILMPGNRISNELTYNFKDAGRFTGSYISGELLNVAKQTRVPDESNGKQDYKAPPAGYSLVNLNAASTVAVGKMNITFGISVRNLFNTKYRDYLNNMRYFTDEMGRNISLRVKIPLNYIYH